MVEAGIEALKAVWHRGAVDADGKTGDGAGIHVQIPQDFFREHVALTGHEPAPGADRGRHGVSCRAPIWAPRSAAGSSSSARSSRLRLQIYGWRQVPVNTDVIGEKANAARPEIEQIMIANSRGVDGPSSSRLDLYIIRRRIERAAELESIKDFYICSLSCRSVIYKGMFLAEQLTAFYPDLLDRASSPTSRSSTSATRPTPSRPGGWPSRSACSPTTARSTPSRATSTG